MRDESTIVALGNRVLLCRPGEADRAAWCDVFSKSRSFLARWILTTEQLEDPDGSRWFDSTLAFAGDPRHEKLIIVRRDGALLGALNINEIVRGSFQSAYLGYWLGLPYVKQGYMAEGLALGVAYAFGPLQLHRVEANVRPENEASIRVVRAAGFLKEGFSEKYLKLGGAWRDHERWALTIERWSELHSTITPSKPTSTSQPDK